MDLRLIQFPAIILTALALVPSGAHLAALPNKMAMEQAAYFVAQQIYAGWAFSGIVLFGAWQRIWRTRSCCAGWADHSAMRSPHFCLLRRALLSFLSGPSRQIKRPATGPLCLRTGMSCAANGNIRTPPMPS
jgi:hypothetical protein